MGMIKGQAALKRFEAGKELNRKDAIWAQCYICNGQEDSRIDCKGFDCPLYPYSPYNGFKKP